MYHNVPLLCGFLMFFRGYRSGTLIENGLNSLSLFNKICKSAANQLNALIKPKQVLGFHVKEVLIKSYIISNFN